MINTTLNKIREHSPCEDSWVELLESLGKTKADDEPLSMVYILDTLGLYDCLWATKSVPEFYKELRLLACDFAEHVLPIFEKTHPGDKRPRECVEVARKFAVGELTREELNASRDAAWDAAGDAARAAGDAARAAAWAARAAAWAAGDAAWVAGDAAGDAAWAARAARDAEPSWQETKLRELLGREASE